MKQRQVSLRQSPILSQILGISPKPDIDEPQLMAVPSQVSLPRRKNFIQENKKQLTLSTAAVCRVLQPRKSDDNVVRSRMASSNKTVNQSKAKPIMHPLSKDNLSCKANKTLQHFKQSTLKAKPKTTNSVTTSLPDSIYLSDEEKKKFETNRFMEGLERLSLVGKGGNALVWLGKGSDSRRLAVKQLCKQGNESATMNEISFYQLLADHPDPEGVIIQLIRHEVQHQFIWLAFPLGAQTMSKALFTMKGQFHKGERVYRISASPLCSLLSTQDDLALLKVFVRRMAQGLKVLKDLEVVHADLKLENVMIMDQEGPLEQQVQQSKIIDFGSCMQLAKHCQDSLNITTPEYMPPELLESLSRPSNKNNGSLLDSLLVIYRNQESVYKIDVWSLGVIILEIMSAIPMWISYKCIFRRKGKDVLGCGLFSNIARSFDKIITKQRQFCGNLQENMLPFMEVRNGCQAQLVDLLQGMLDCHHPDRLSIEQVLAHPFLA